MIDSPPRKRDPLQLAAQLARMSNDISLSDTEAAVMKDAAVTLRHYHDALSRLGVTMGQMESDAIGRLVEAAKRVVGPAKKEPVITWLPDGSPQVDAKDNCREFLENWCDLEDALKPFTKKE